MFTGRFVLDIPLGTGRFLNQMAKWYRLGAYRLNPFGVREVSKPRAIRQHHSRAVLIPLKSGKFLNRNAIAKPTLDEGLNPFEVREVSKLLKLVNTKPRTWS